MSFLKIIELIALGLAPSLIWLFYYLRKDVHPEPNRIVIAVFSLGLIITPLVALLEKELSPWLSQHLPPGLLLTGAVFLGAAFIEEWAKYLVVRVKILGHPQFDEPVDSMIYLIIAALGFAAAENILSILNIAWEQNFLGGQGWLSLQPLIISTLFLRFLGATLLHTLASGILGYFLAIKYFHLQKLRRPRRFLITQGLLYATLIHGSFNILITQSQNLRIFLYDFLVVMLLLTALLAVLIEFRRLIINS